LRAYTGSIPINHDLEQVIRLAELTSTLIVLATYRRQDEGDRFDTHGAAPPPFINAARNWLHQQIGLSPSMKVVPNDALVTEVNRRLDGLLVTSAPEGVRTLLKDAERQVWDELTTGAGVGEPPAEFRRLFLGDEASEPGWAVTFLALIREAFKKTPRAEIAFVTTRLGAVRSALDRVETKIGALNAEVIAGHRKLDDIADAMEHRHRELLDAIARGKYVNPEDEFNRRERPIGSEQELKSLFSSADQELIKQWFTTNPYVLPALFGRLWRVSETLAQVALGNEIVDFVIINGQSFRYEVSIIFVGDPKASQTDFEVIRGTVKRLEAILEWCSKNQYLFLKSIGMRLANHYGSHQFFSFARTVRGEGQAVQIPVSIDAKLILGRRKYLPLGRSKYYDAEKDKVRSSVYEASRQTIEIVSYDRVIDAMRKIGPNMYGVEIY
jgi:hypothetical protein